MTSTRLCPNAHLNNPNAKETVIYLVVNYNTEANQQKISLPDQLHA